VSTSQHRITLSWNDDLQHSLDAINEQARTAGVFEHSIQRVARRTLEMIQRGEQPNADDIVAYMRDHDRPPVGTWAVDEPYFRRRAEQIVEALCGDNPAHAILNLKLV
jgi:hypothetical protein